MSMDYTQALKSIKDAEEASAREINERKKSLEENLRLAEEDAARTIAQAKKDGEAIIASEVEQARLSAQSAADRLLASSNTGAAKLASKKVTQAELRKTIEDVLFADFKGAK